jgi:DNA-damage-inducible protein D
MSALLPSATLFEQNQIRRLYDDATETWWFSVIDIIQALIQQPDYQTARKYWNKLKQRLDAEGSQLVTNCHRLKLEAADGKKYLTDVATAETLLRLVQSVPSPKAEPIKLWLAKVGFERMQEMADPSLGLGSRTRDMASAWPQREVDPAADDGPGDPQQAHGLLEGPRHQGR